MAEHKTKANGSVYSPVETTTTDEEMPVVIAAAVVPQKVEPKLEIVSPSDLPGGYEFSVDAAGRHMIVSVPEGGVTKGQRFQATIVRDMEAGNYADQDEPSHRIPVGAWRDGLCDCCAHGCCHPTCCLGFWCPPCALGQVMTRMSLNWYGEQIPNGRRVTFSTFKILAIAFLFYLCLNQAISILISPYTGIQFDENGDIIPRDQREIPGWAQGLNAFVNILHLVWVIFIVFLIIRTRSYIRRKYAIPEQCCIGIEDCCCSYWCGPCTICQMARHTADYNRYKAGCCTDDGLDGTRMAPLVV